MKEAKLTAHPGEVVLTSYGVATVISSSVSDDSLERKTPPSEGEQSFFRARLWRVPDRSVLSSSVAYLRHDTVIKTLPAAPGMKSFLKSVTGDENTKSKCVLVHRYSAYDDMYAVSPVKQNGNDTLWTSGNIAGGSPSHSEKKTHETKLEKKLLMVKSSDLEPAKCAKFYPLIDELVRRGDEAALLSDGFLNLNVDRVMNDIESSVENIEIGKTLSAENVCTVPGSLQQMVPTAKEVTDIYSMLKDEEITVLLEKGKDRLNQLISTEIPEATEAALRVAGIEVEQGNAKAMEQVRHQAFEALDALISEYANSDMKAMHESVVKRFTDSFDSLAEAAASDHTLSSIFEAISEKTVVWQSATGRLLETKGIDLFMEGSQRLQARAAEIFSMQQTSLMSEGGLARAFTEGDVAVARLKSIELGEAVRARLFDAIEARSESQGGLDGIIAGALAALGKEEVGEDNRAKLHETIQSLQNSASATTKSARETLISLISDRSIYQDIVLLKVESILVDLDAHFGEHLSAEDLASLVRGSKGSSALFEPIAQKAASEIGKQLDSIEESLSDPTALSILSRVRRIISGDLTLDGLVSEVASVLNDEQVVMAGASIIKQGEMVLDAIESGNSGNKTMDGVMTAVEKAGITKETVIDHVGNMDMNSLLTSAESAVSDEKARQQLLSHATDSALDFVLRILPSMPVPDFDGVRDGLLYHLSNLSMEGFKVKKEDIHVEIAGIKTSSVTAEEGVEGINSNTQRSSTEATEILCIYVENISAVFENAVWSFEQTYMPYLKGSGMASAKLWGGIIKLQFELRKKRTPSSSEAKEKWEPVLCLHDRKCEIEEFDLLLQGDGKVAWFVNKLSAIFKAPLRDYVVRIILDGLASRSGALLESLNNVLSPCWSLVLQMASLSMEDLVEISDDDVTSSAPDPNSNQVDLVWRERIPLGINLLLNDDSGYVKVVDFPRGSQARKVAQEKNLDVDLFKGATIVAVDGSSFEQYDQASVMSALRDPGRPKTINFLLADNDEAERVKKFVQGSEDKRISADSAKTSEQSKLGEEIIPVEIKKEGPLGIKFAHSYDNYCLVVSEFVRGPEGKLYLAEATGRISLGNVLISVNGNHVVGDDGEGREKAVVALKDAAEARPLSLVFANPYLSSVLVKAVDDIGVVGGPDELILSATTTSNSTRIIIQGFKTIDGIAESRGVFIGDHLIFVNGLPVGAGCQVHDSHFPQLKEVVAMLENEDNYPIALTFARPSQQTSRWTASYALDVETAETFCVTANKYKQLGFELGSGRARGEVVVKAFHAVEGSLQENFRKEMKQMGISQDLAIESIDGQVVPSYASCDMIMSALKRVLSSKGETELVLCNVHRKDWVRQQCKGTK